MPSALSVARPAGAAVVLLATVAVTGVTLYFSWPVGVAVGVALGTAAVLAVGARMQVTDRLQPVDPDLAERLGLATVAAPAPAPAPAPVAVERTAEPAAAEPAPAETAAAAPVLVEAPAEPEAEPVLHAQPDVLYFTSDDDPDAVEVREVVTAANDIIAVPEQTAAPIEGAVPAVVADPVRADLEQLKVDLGEDYRDFARAARLVVSTQYASAARLQRDLDLPYSRARRLLSDLEEQHFVGPATGSLPRQVLLPKERLPELEELLADV